MEVHLSGVTAVPSATKIGTGKDQIGKNQTILGKKKIVWNFIPLEALNTMDIGMVIPATLHHVLPDTFARKENKEK